jgi:dTMP kinase
MKKGRLIVFEGINGCGKGTQIDFFTSSLRKSGKAVPYFVSGEPNDFGEYGKLARKMLSLDGDPYENNLQAVKYFAKNRKDHNKIFNRDLKKGIDVLLDRYYHSNFAFQHAQGIPYEKIAKANKKVRIPDITFIIDVPVEVAFKRLDERDGIIRRKFDSDYKFMEKVRENYLELKILLPFLMGDTNIVYINGNCERKEIASKITIALIKLNNINP